MATNKEYNFKTIRDFGTFAEEGNVSFEVQEGCWIIDGKETATKINIRSFRNTNDGKSIPMKGIALTEEQFNNLILLGIENGYGVKTEKKNKKKQLTK